MARLEPPAPADYDEDQRRIADSVIASRGSVRGPFGPWLHAPGLADPAPPLGAYLRFASTMPDNLRELAICTGARHWRANFEWHAHAPLAEGAGIPAEAIERLRTGEAPEPLSPDERLVHGLAREILETGRLSDRAHDAGRGLLGERGLVELVGICGYYSLVSFTLNVFDVAVPEGDPPFPGA